jgi:hypothetical protein
MANADRINFSAFLLSEKDCTSCACQYSQHPDTMRVIVSPTELGLRLDATCNTEISLPE